MKTTFFGALALCLSCSLASAQPAQAPVKSDAQLLFDKCRAAYGALKSYRGTTKTDNLSLINGAEYHYRGSATFLYAKPNLLRIDGKLAGPMGGEFSIFSVPEGTWLRWPAENGGKWMKAADYSEAVSKMTGVAALAPTTISYLLFAPQEASTFSKGEMAKTDGEEKIGDADCFKITAPTATETTSWWIDKKSFLLRRIVTSFDEEQAKASAARLKKMMEKYAPATGEKMPEIQIRQISNTEDFEIAAVNEAVDENLFAGPDAK